MGQSYESLGGNSAAAADRVFAVFDRQRTQLERMLERMPNEEPVFVGLGESDSVLEFLRFPKDATVPNLRMSKKDCEETIRAIWKQRGPFDKESCATTPLSSFFTTYVAETLVGPKGTPKDVATAAYNLYDACKRYMYDADVETFYSIVSGKLEEAAYHEEMAIFNVALPKFIAKKDCEYNQSKKPKGKIDKKHFPELIMEFWPGKPQSSLEELIDALDKDEPKDSIAYKKLFAEDKSLDQRLFVEKLRDQYKSERANYFVRLRKVVGADREDHDTMTAQQWREAFLDMDSQIPKDEADLEERGLEPSWGHLEEYICRGYDRKYRDKSSPKVPNQLATTVAAFIENLKNGGVRAWSRLT